jgi:hypothetical protein
MIKSGKIRWVGYLTCMGENRNTCKALTGKPEEEGDYLEYLGIKGGSNIKMEMEDIN